MKTKQARERRADGEKRRREQNRVLAAAIGAGTGVSGGSSR
jgi:hypothetical protein